MMSRWIQINAEVRTTLPLLGLSLIGFSSECICGTSKGVVVTLLRRHKDPRECLEA